MKHSQQLHRLLSNDVIPEVEQFMQKMQAFSNTNETTPQMQEDQAGIVAILENFMDILHAIEDGSIEEENCEQLLNEITTMRKMGSEGAL